MSKALARVRSWVFDLDNTLYPAEDAIYDQIEARMTAYIADALALDAEAAANVRERYFYQYGATVAGLARHHGVDAADFVAHVHDVAADALAPDEDLNALITALPGRKIVFTNGGAFYARRVLRQLGLAQHFDHVCDIEAGALYPKPQREAYRRLVTEAAIVPAESALIEDTLRNLEPADEMGFLTVLVGPVHPDPLPPYVDHYAHDLKAFLREALGLNEQNALARGP